MPFAAADSVTVTVSVWPDFRSAIVTLENGAMVCRSVVNWPATVPLIVGGTATSVVTTVVVLFVAVASAVSVSAMVKVVVTVRPGAT